jgi:hypothetical protein
MVVRHRYGYSAGLPDCLALLWIVSYQSVPSFDGTNSVAEIQERHAIDEKSTSRELQKSGG